VNDNGYLSAEDTKMTRKAMETNSLELSRVLKSMEVERLKGKIVAHASNHIINFLNKITKANTCHIVKSDISKLEGTHLFNGIMYLKVAVLDKGLTKELNIPISVVNSDINLPDQEIIIQKLAEVETKDEIKLKADSLVKKHMDSVETKINKQEENSLKAAKERDNARKGIEIKAKEVPLPAGGNSAVPSALVAKQIVYPKANLPASVKAGDEIPVAGRKYKVEEAPSTFQGNVSTDWVLVLIN
jgi:hypothetical protein